MYSIKMFVTIQTSAEITVTKLKRLDSINHVHCSLYTPSLYVHILSHWLFFVYHRIRIRGKKVFKDVAPFSTEGEVVCLREFMPILKEENSYVIMYAFVVLFTFL